MVKRGRLTNFTAKKPGDDETVENSPPEETKPKPADKATTKAMTLRLNLDAWRQLRLLALDDGCTAHALLIDAINGYFRERGKSPLA